MRKTVREMNEQEQKDVVDTLITFGSVYCETDDYQKGMSSVNKSSALLDAVTNEFGVEAAITCLGLATEALMTKFERVEASFKTPSDEQREESIQEIMRFAKTALDSDESMDARIQSIMEAREYTDKLLFHFGPIESNAMIDEAQRRFEGRQ